MRRQFNGNRLVIATHNSGKLAEINALMAPKGIDVVSAGDLGLPSPEETGSTFEENAILKAVAAAKGGNCPALADDSGLMVKALQGAPGVYSARWGGPEGDFQKAMALVEEKLQGHQDRSAAFACCLALAWPDGHVETVFATCEGALIWPPRGEQGFGYDPIFVAIGEARSFGEMTSEEKRKYSHRAKAFSMMMDQCFVG